MKNKVVIFVMGLLCTAATMAQVTLRPEVAQPLQAAQEDMAAKRFSQALDHARKARAVSDLTPAEKSLVEQIVAAAAIESRDYPKAIEATGYLSRDASLTPASRLTYSESLISLLRVTKDVPRLVEATRRYLDEGGAKESIREVHVQALSILGRHQEVIDFMGLRLKSEKPFKASEQELRALAVAYKSLKDEAGYYTSLKLLLKEHASRDYWFDLLTRLQKQPFFNGRYELDVYRLMHQLELLEEADDFFYYAQLALKSGLPAEARGALNAGIRAKVFTTDAQNSSLRKLEQSAIARQAEDDRQLKQIKDLDQPQTAADLAEVYLSRGDYPGAIRGYDKALGMQALRREAEYRLHQLMVLVKNGQRDKAQAVLPFLSGDRTAQELGELWLNVR